MATKGRRGWQFAALGMFGAAAVISMVWGASIDDAGTTTSLPTAGSASTVVDTVPDSTSSATAVVEPTTVGSPGSIEVVQTRGTAISPAGDLLIERPGHSIYAWDTATLTRELVMLGPDDTSVTIQVGVVDGGPDLPDPLLRETNVYQSHGAQSIAIGTATEIAADGRSTVVFDIAITPDPSLIELGLAYQTNRRVTMDVKTWAVLDVTITMSDGAMVADELAQGLNFGQISAERLHPAATAVSPPTYFAGGFERMASLDGLGFSTYSPGWMPDGFTLSMRAYATQALSRVERTTEVAAVTYRNGTAAITVTFRPSRDESPWPDPWNQWGDATIEGVYKYSSSAGEFTIAPPSFWVTHAWGVVGGTLVTIDGAISTADIERVIDGLSK